MYEGVSCRRDRVGSATGDGLLYPKNLLDSRAACFPIDSE